LDEHGKEGGMKMKKMAYFFLLIIIIPINACSSRDSFYEKGSGWDHLRFPLLKPYYAIYISDEYEWEISLQDGILGRNFKYFSAILNAKKIAVDKGIIMVFTSYSKPIYVSPEQEKELHWFILIPDQTELGFETEEEFTTQIKKYDISQPSWQEPESILKTYDQTRCLDWIPGCK
jgi:hypothetical protein